MRKEDIQKKGVCSALRRGVSGRGAEGGPFIVLGSGFWVLGFVVSQFRSFFSHFAFCWPSEKRVLFLNFEF